MKALRAFDARIKRKRKNSVAKHSSMNYSNSVMPTKAKTFLVLAVVMVGFGGCVSVAERSEPPENPLHLERIEHESGELLKYVDQELDLVFMTGDRAPLSRHMDLSSAVSWRGMRPRAFADSIRFYRRVLMETYPTETIRDCLEIIVLASANRIADSDSQTSRGSRSWASIPHRGIVMSTPLDYRRNPKEIFDLLNHEMAHIITLTEDRYHPIQAAWRTQLPDGFLYVEEANEQKATDPVFYDGPTREMVAHGFVSLYAQISIEEDLAETATVALGRPLETQSSRPLQKKTELIRQLYREANPKMDSAWFQSVHEFRSSL
jgi:hypothetical protein